MPSETIGLYAQRGVIQDSVHGFIPINEAEYYLLQTPFFRRLHNIKQLGMSFLVFPSARHSRLEHSLGVMHLMWQLGRRVVEELAADQRLCQETLEDCDDKHFNTFIQVARLVGMLHDVGHLAYSHMSEEAIKDIAHFSDSRSKALFDELTLYSGSDALKVHEAYGVAFSESLARLAEGSDFPALKSTIEAAVASLRRGAQGSEREALNELGLRDNAILLLHDMISNEIADADRLDYLQRDAQATGIVYGNIDVARLLAGIKLQASSEGRPVLTLDIKSLQTLEDVFDARYKMYRSVYFHHKTISLAKSVTRFLRLVSTLDLSWLGIYGNQTLQEAIRPTALSNAIMNDDYYFDDPELDLIVRGFASGSVKDDESRVIRRWALSMLDRRDLLPLSLIKRSEEVTMIADSVLRSNGRAPTGKLVSELIDMLHSHVEYLEETMKSKLKVDDMKLDAFESYVISSDRLNEGNINVFNWNESMYLRALIEQGSMPVILLYAYSDDESSHLKLRQRANELRSVAREKIGEIMREGLKELRA